MSSFTEAEKLLFNVCEVDSRINLSVDKETKEVVIKELESRFYSIVEKFPHLLNDIQKRITKYQSLKEAGVTDFIHLVEWYGMYLTDNKKDVGYWNPKGKYYDLRMNEVINMFLISKVNL